MTNLEYLFDRANKAGVALSIEENAEYDYATMIAEKSGKKYTAHFNLNMHRDMRYKGFEFYLEEAIRQFDNLEKKADKDMPKGALKDIPGWRYQNFDYEHISEVINANKTDT